LTRQISEGAAQDAGLTGPGGLGAAGLWADQAETERAGRHGRGQGAGRGDDPAVQGQFPHGRPVGERIRVDDAHGRHHRQGDGQVVVAALLGQVGRRQIADDPATGHGQAQSGEGGPHALPALGYGLVAQSDQHEFLLAAGELHLDVHRPRLDPLERDRDDACSHASSPPDPVELSTTPARDAGRIKNKKRTL
jgi:hypothetical protein